MTDSYLKACSTDNLETDLVQEDPLLVEPPPRKTVELQLHLFYLVHDSTIRHENIISLLINM